MSYAEKKIVEEYLESRLYTDFGLLL
jgi:hypothetical protein